MYRRPLFGIRVLDLSRVLAGPYCTMILGDLGAEIIKVEIPGRGDDSREFGPFIGNESVYFLSLNRNKKSITLNLKNPIGKDILLELVTKVDVLVENFRPGTMENLGLGYDVLKTANPRLVYAACSGFGHTGPYSHKRAYDQIVQGMGGIMSITGHPGGPPTRVGASIGDIAAGMYTAIGILAALRYRDVTGEGQKVDVAMLDCQVAILENAIARYFVEGKSPGPIGNRHPSLSPFGSIRTKDGYLNVAVGNDPMWVRFCEALGKRELASDPRFTTNALRTRNWSELEPILEEVFATRTTTEWIAALEEAEIPCGPINNIEQVVNDPQIRAREMVVEVEHPGIGGVKMAGIPVKFSLTPCSIQTPAPGLGEHTKEVLQAMLGISDEEYDRLSVEGAI
ncbi:MAG TPA: CoA transferase [Firmicutes bacterium]|nr:CoA transferase [Bacillota bacterium]